jgi:heterodisulfide reductase subunit C
MVKRVARRLPFKQGFIMGWQTLFRPRTRGWRKASAALQEYIDEQETKQRKALNLE